MTTIGNLTDVGLLDLIQVTCTQRQSARIWLENAAEDAAIYVDDGEIVHAQLGSREGPEALHEILSWNAGVFRLEADVPPPSRTVEGNWTATVLNAMVDIDHDTAAGNGGGESLEEQGGEMETGEIPPKARWIQALETIPGVREVVAVTASGAAASGASELQSEEGGALTAYAGNAAREISNAFALGELQTAAFSVDGSRRLVFHYGEVHVGLRLGSDCDSRQIIPAVRRILRRERL